MQDNERDEILIELRTDMCWVKKMLSNHLHTHKSLAIAMVGIIGTLVVGIVIALLV